MSTRPALFREFNPTLACLSSPLLVICSTLQPETSPTRPTPSSESVPLCALWTERSIKVTQDSKICSWVHSLVHTHTHTLSLSLPASSLRNPWHSGQCCTSSFVVTNFISVYSLCPWPCLICYKPMFLVDHLQDATLRMHLMVTKIKGSHSEESSF